MNHNIKASIIIVNYNGKQYLENCLSSIYNLSFPANQFEVIVVDNNSSDLSRGFLKKHYPQVRLIESAVNLGFSAGNNLGIKNANGELVVLLNNDTIVDKNWLSSLVTHIDSDTTIGAVNSKLLRYYPFIELTIKSDMYSRAEFSAVFSQETVGVLLEHVLLEDTHLQPLVHYRSGFYSEEKGPIKSRWTKGNASVLIPVDPSKENLKTFVTIHSKKFPSSLKTKIELKLGEVTLATDVLEAHQVKQYELTIPVKKISNSFLYQVQNAGNIIFKLGAARDRGAVTKGTYQTYEIDSDYFKQPADVTGFCGASVILRKQLFEELGGFDESFFMYYEDIDLSLRLQLKGYKIRFEPNSIAYHYHSGSSKEGSDLFVYNVEKNFLAVLLKFYPFSIIVTEVLRYIAMTIITFLKMIKWRLLEHWELFEEFKKRLKVRVDVLQWVTMNLPQLLIKRSALRANATVPIEKVYKDLY